MYGFVYFTDEIEFLLLQWYSILGSTYVKRIQKKIYSFGWREE